MRSLISSAVFGLALTLVPSPPSAPPSQRSRLQQHFPFLPVDEAPQDPEFKAFRDRFIEAVKARDAATVVEHMSPSVRKDWGNWFSLPRSAFIGGAEQTTWGELERLLALGGAFTMERGAVLGRREFCAPYVYGAYPVRVPPPIEGEANPWAIIKDRVPLRRAMKADAPVITYLSYELVKADGWLEADGVKWAEVELLDGRTGYVREGDIRDPTDYHACFAPIDGRWIMTTLGRSPV